MKAVVVVLFLCFGAYGQATITVPAGGDLQAAINAAQLGDTIVLQADTDYTCSCVLPNKTGQGYVTIQSSRYGDIPVRDFYSTEPSAETKRLMARIKSFYSTEPIFAAAPGAHHYKLLGLDIFPSPGQATRLVEFGGHGTIQDTLEEMPHDFVIDKSWLHAAANQEIQRCLSLNSSNTDVTNSWLTECHGNGYDTQAIGGWNGGGNYRIVNNALSGAGENFMLGGAQATIPNLVPTNIEFRRNYVWKPLSWYANDPSYAGVHWSVKNLFELKNARQVIIEGNVFDGNWTDAQAGRAIVFTPRPSDSGSWAVVEDVEFKNNIVRNAGSGMLILGADESPAPTETRLRRVQVTNNIFLVDGPRFASNGFFLTVIHKTEDVTIEHNTAIQTGNIIGADYDPNVRFIYRNNISRHNDYGIFGGGIGNAALAQYFPGGIVTGNVMTRELNGPSNLASLYPAGNYFPELVDDVQFEDAFNGNYKLKATSPFKGKATDGKDPGVDMGALLAAQGSASPLPTPSPTPTPSPSPSPTPSPSPSPTPTPVPLPCSMEAPAVVSVAPNSIGVIAISMNAMQPQPLPFIVKAVSETPGQVFVYPSEQQTFGTSSILSFSIRVKKRGARVSFTSPCAPQSTTVLVR